MDIVVKIVEAISTAIATQTVNSTCWFNYYQEKLPESFDVLKKHDD